MSITGCVVSRVQVVHLVKHLWRDLLKDEQQGFTSGIHRFTSLNTSASLIPAAIICEIQSQGASSAPGPST